MEHQRAGRLEAEIRRFALMLSVAALLILTIVVVRVSYAAAVTGPADERLRADLSALAESDRAVLDADSAVHGYLLSGDAFFADRARRDLPLTRSAERMSETDDNPDRRRSLVALVRAEQQWQTGWVERALTPPGPGTPVPDAFLREGADLVDRYLEASATVRSAADAEAVANAHLATAMSRGAGAAVGVIGLVSLVLARRWRRRLVRNVVDPVDGLLASVRDISEGRLQEPGPVTGSAELVDLRDGLAEMTRALRRQREDSAAQAGRLHAQGDGLRTVLKMAREIAGSLNTRYVVGSTVEATETITGGPVRLWLLDEEGGGLELAFESGRGPVPPLDRQCSLGLGLVGRCARYGQVTRAEDGTGDEGVAVPLVVGARVIGVLECLAGPGGAPEEEALSSIEMLATLAGSAIEASRLHAATERLSQFDPLTQLANRRRLEPDLDRAVANAVRHGHAMSVIMIDLDHFKQLNDRYGHQQGDVVLQEFASTMQSTMRAGETAYRYGGEEFAILIEHGTAGEAAVLAERLRARVENEFHRGGRQLVTASFGIASLPDDADDSSPLLAAADRALYAAKDAGRNRVGRTASTPPRSDHHVEVPAVGSAHRAEG